MTAVSHPRVMQASLTTCERRSLADSLNAASMRRSCCGNPSNSAAPASSSERTFFSWMDRTRAAVNKHSHLTDDRTETTGRKSYSRHAELPVPLVIGQHVANLRHGLLYLPVGVDLVDENKKDRSIMSRTSSC